MYVTISLSLYSVYNSLLYFILHSPFLFVGPKMALKIFLSKTAKMVSSDFDNTQVSEAMNLDYIITQLRRRASQCNGSSRHTQSQKFL